MNKDKIIKLAIDGLLTDGEHHKQWYLERILKACDVDLEKLKKEMNDYEWKDGIEP